MSNVRYKEGLHFRYHRRPALHGSCLVTKTYSASYPPQNAPNMSQNGRSIELRGVSVHNLKSVDLDIPRGRLTVFCGPSGSGKTSLALDTLYAEGQRRYIESFSAYTRQFLDRLEKPDAERIDGVPPAVAVTHAGPSKSSRATVGAATEAVEYLRLLFSKIVDLVCHGCQQPVQRDDVASITSWVNALPDGAKFLVTFPALVDAGDIDDTLASLVEQGFVRAIFGQQVVRLDDNSIELEQTEDNTDSQQFDVIVDRLVAGQSESGRLADSLETAIRHGAGHVAIYVEAADDSTPDVISIDNRNWRRTVFSNDLTCPRCQIEYPAPLPKLFSFNSPLGACPTCEGFGDVIDIDIDLVVPDPDKSLRDGAIAPWNTKAYAHESEELLALADDYNLPVDIPYRELNDEHRELIREGVAERDFGGLNGFFNWLERRKYKMHIRVFLSRWRSYRRCPTCDGDRLRPDALAYQIGGKNIAQLCQMTVDELRQFLTELLLSDDRREVGRMMLEQLGVRAGYLSTIGLGYLTLDRSLRTLSGGEAQRVTLTSALGSNLVNMLYVLDEPSRGLHVDDVRRIVDAIARLRDRGNTVVVVEHDEAILRSADRIVELGPGAGQNGGKITYEGEVDQLEQTEGNLTGDYLAGRRGALGRIDRKPPRGRVHLKGARGNNLQNIDVEFPLGVLCVVTGVSGSGKSTLVEQTLYPALCRRLKKNSPAAAAYDDVFGEGQIDDVAMVDQSAIGRSPRSNPVTYIKAFDHIRAVFAETTDARMHNYTAGHFSFNVDDGRCNHCKGDGFLEIDMQFLADVYMRCPRCRGRRYRNEILKVHYRGRNIADVLEMTVRQAFSFFRGQVKVQTKLKFLIDVGLEYLRLGQPANTLSGGESQRLRLAGYLATAKRGRCLFLLDEPTTGLHFSDVAQLLDCFTSLRQVGHSLIIVEHSMQVITAADYLIDIGPGPAKDGGQVVATGTPEEVAQVEASVTGRYLRECLTGK